MAEGGVIRALFVKLGIKTDPAKLKAFEDGVDKAKIAMKEAATQAKAWRQEMAQRFTLGVLAATGALAANAVQVAKNAREVVLFSEKLGVSTDTLQRLQFAAGASEQDLQTLHDTMQTLGERAQDSIVDGPTSDAAEMIKRLGIDVKDTSGNIKDNATLFFDLADAITAIESPTAQAATAMTLLGDDGVRLLPILNKGSAHLRAMGDDAERLGFILNEKALVETEKLSDSLVETKAAVKGMRQALAIELIPQVLKVTEGFNKWIQTGDNAKKTTEALILVMRGLAVAIGLVAAAKAKALFIGIANGAKAAAASLKVVAIWLTKINKRLLAMAAGASVLFILVIILQDIFVWLRGGESLVGDFIAKFAESKGILGDVARWLIQIKPALADMLAQGMAFVKRVLPVMIQALREVAQVIVNIATSIIPMLSKSFEDAKGSVKGLVDTVVGKILPAVEIMVGAFMDRAGPLFTQVSGLFKSLFALVMVFVNGVVEIVAVLFDSFGDVLGSLVELGMTTAGLYFNIVWQSVKVIIKIAKGLFGVIVAGVKAIAPLVKVIFGVVASVIELALPIISTVVGGIFDFIVVVSDWMLRAVNFVIGLIETGVTEFTPIVQGVIDTIVGVITTVVEGITSAVTFVIDVITGIVNFITTIVTFVGDVLGGAVDGFFAFWEGLVGFVAPIIGAVASVIKAAFDIVLSIVRPIIKTILKAINLVRKLARKSAITLDLSGGSSVDIDAEVRKAQAAAQTNVNQARSRQGAGRGDTDQSVKVQQLQVNVGGTPAASAADIARKARAGVNKGLGDVQRRQAARDLAAG